MSLFSQDLEAFLQIAEAGTIRAAAARIHLTQPAVTRRLANLEAMLGSTLFLRTSKGMNLTPEGVELLRAAREMSALQAATLSRMAGRRGAVTLRVRIRGPSSLVRARLLAATAPLLEPVLGAETETVSIEWQLDDSEPGAEPLRRHVCDFAIMSPSVVPAAFSRRVLAPERYVMVVPKSWANRPQREVVAEAPIVDFSPDDTLTHRYLELVDLRGLARPERHFANNTDAVATLVAAGVGYSVLSEEFATPYVERGELQVLRPDLGYLEKHAVVWHPRRFWPKAMRGILSALR